MGCDMHLRVERRLPDGRWGRFQIISDCVWCNGTGDQRRNGTLTGEVCWFCDGSGKRADYQGGRNYRLFGVRAGVRSDTRPIRAPRGYPIDAATGWYVEGSSKIPTGNEPTWEFPASSFTPATAVKHVPPTFIPRELPEPGEEEAFEWDLPGDPDNHTHSWLTLRELHEHDWSQYEPSGSMGYFILFLDQLGRLGGSPDDVRIVFAFDN